MNVVRLMGGVGNQFFQYAFAEVLRRNGKEVLFESTWFQKPRKEFRPFRLGSYNTDITLSNDFNKLRRISDDGKKDCYLIYDNCYFYGYWQYLQWYESLQDHFKEVFTLKECLKSDTYKEWADKIEATNGFGIHIRRGDYLKTDWFLPILYYLNTYSRVVNEYNIQGDVFIFSDDPEYFEQYNLEQYFGRPTHIIKNMPDYLSLELLKKCKNLMLSSSTFSWWGAFLNENQDCKVFAPLRWLSYPGDPYNYIYPINWIKF